MAKINCRVRKSKDCFHGREESEVYDESTMAEDGTWDGESVVCDACYIVIGMPVDNADPGRVAGGRGRP